MINFIINYTQMNEYEVTLCSINGACQTEEDASFIVQADSMQAAAKIVRTENPGYADYFDRDECDCRVNIVLCK